MFRIKWERETCLLFVGTTQCAAVRTCLSLIRVPPQFQAILFGSSGSLYPRAAWKKQKINNEINA